MSQRSLVIGGAVVGLALLCCTVVTFVILAKPVEPGVPAAPAGGREPRAASAPRDAGPAAAAAVAEPERTAWRPASGPLSRAVDVAFTSGASLSTDGKVATFDPGDGNLRPVDVPAAIPRVFAAAGRLLAVGENDGAPFAIVLAPGEDPLVVPMPCPVVRLAGEGTVLAGLCADGSGLAVSADAGKSFRPVPISLPAPAGTEDVEVERALEAVSVSPAGALLVASTQRWKSETAGGALAWTWGQATWRAGGSRALRTSNVEALARTVGAHLSGGSATLAGLQVALDGSADGDVRTRLFRGAEGEPPVAIGVAGPACGTAATAPGVEGVLLGTEVAYFACGERLVSTLDGGATWSVDRALGAVEVLRGGDMRLFARAGERTWERRFVDRSETGATAVRLPGVAVPRRDGGVAGPVVLPFGIREPVDAGDAPADATP